MTETDLHKQPLVLIEGPCLTNIIESLSFGGNVSETHWQTVCCLFPHHSQYKTTLWLSISSLFHLVGDSSSVLTHTSSTIRTQCIADQRCSFGSLPLRTWRWLCNDNSSCKTLSRSIETNLQLNAHTSPSWFVTGQSGPWRCITFSDWKSPTSLLWLVILNCLFRFGLWWVI